MKKHSRYSDDQFDFRPKADDSYVEQKASKKEKMEIYKCGDTSCAKFYHSYTAFYNHCKKSHHGQFPQNSIYNGALFAGPSKNRGRPRIKKNQTKDEAQIESMKRQNELIEFLGTLKTKRAQELIVYVQNPIQRLEGATAIVEDWLNKTGEHTQANTKYLRQLQGFNLLVSEHDLPEFYDPVEADLYRDKLDSYNFSSIFHFMNDPERRLALGVRWDSTELLFKIHSVWLARILSQKLLAEVVYTILQIQNGIPIKERDLLIGRSDKFKEITQKYFACFGADTQKKEE